MQHFATRFLASAGKRSHIWTKVSPDERSQYLKLLLCVSTTRIECLPYSKVFMGPVKLLLGVPELVGTVQY